MRKTVSETLKTSSSAEETHDITYTYDSLNRITSEIAACSSPAGSYSQAFEYDVVGNRTYRQVVANGENLETEYQYDTGIDAQNDRLSREIHTGPVAFIPVGDERYYAYADGGGLSYQTAGGAPIGKLKAFLLGLPNELAGYVLAMFLICIPVIFLVPAIGNFAERLIRPLSKRRGAQLSLWQRCLCVLLAYMMLIPPAGLESLAQASSQYSQITAADWATHKYVEYGYDANGSCTSKTTKDSSSAVVQSVNYDYDLRNRLERVTTVTSGTNEVKDVTEYTYNDDGIRVESVYRLYIDDVEQTSSRETVVFLVDSQNHTGYAQVLEETLYDHADAFVSRKTYTIGDDVLTQSKYDGAVTLNRHILYDGHGSTRQLTGNTGALAANQTFSYDAYGVLIGYTGTPETNLLYAGEYFDQDLQQYNLRARYYNPLNGRFNRMDDFGGKRYDPQSLHKYLYCHANPTNNIDPSGEMTLAEISVTVKNVTVNLSVRIKTAFAAGGAAIGRFWNELGRFVENTAQQIFSLFSRLEVFASQHVETNIIDFVVRLGNRIAQVEVKYSLPQTGAAFTRMIDQINSMVIYGQGQSVIWTLKEPTVSQLATVQQTLGVYTFNQVQFIHGIEGLYQWVTLYFGL